MLFELLLTLGLVSTILGTASGAQNVGLFGALAVGGYIILAGFWSRPIQRRIDEPGQVVRPGCCQRRLLELLVHIVGPLAGALIAVAFAWILRGPGGGRSALRSAGRIGVLETEREQK